MAKKDFGRRLMPEYLLKYAEELNKNHPDPSASWGGGGGDYTAGEGIEISDQDVISIDEEVVAKKTDIPDVSDFVTDTDLTTALADYELKSEAFSGSYNDLTDKPTLFSGDYEDLTNKPDLSIYAESADLATVATTGDYDDLLNKPTIPTKTSDLQNDSGFITGVSWNEVSGKPSFATVATSGDYDDLLNKPTIPTVDYPVTDVQVDGVSVVSNKVASITMPTVPTKTSDLQNDSGFITGVSWADVTGKPTFATVATSGSYNDLSDKPSIPSSSNFVDLTSNQTIGGSKIFSSPIMIGSLFAIGGGAFWLDIQSGGVTTASCRFELPTNKATGDYTLATTADIPTVPTKTSDLQNDSGFITSSALSGYATETWVGQQGYLTSVSWNDVSSKPTFATVATSGSYTDLTDKPSIPSAASSTSTVTPTTETLVFTLDDDSTVTVNVMTGATVSTTTTLS